MAKRTEREFDVIIGGRVDKSLNKSVKEINNRMDDFGSTAKKVAAIATAAFASIQVGDFINETLVESKKMETSMAGVSKVVDGLKGSNGELTDSYYAMKDSIVEMSTDMPMVADGISAIMEAAGQSNIPKKELEEFTEDAVQMGIAFDSTADQAGEWMAAWRTALNMDQSQVVELADQINYLGNTSSEDAIKLSEVVTIVGSLAKTAGVSTSSVAAMAASMTKVDSAVAATGIKNFSLGLVMGESATKKQKTAFDELGLSAENVAKSMQTDSKGTIIDVLERINALSKEEQTSVLKNLFGKESISSIAPMVSNLDNLKEQLNKVGDSALYANSMQQEYLIASSTSENLDTLTENKYKAMQMEIGDSLLPLANEFTEVKGQIFDSIRGLVSDNAPEIGDAIEDMSESLEKFLPNAVYGIKDITKGIKDFAEPFIPIAKFLVENPDIIGKSLIGIGVATETYNIAGKISSIAKAASEAGGPLKYLSGVITNPWGLAIAGVAVGVSALAIAFQTTNKIMVEENLNEHFGDISLSLEDLDEVAKQILGSKRLEKLQVSMQSFDKLDGIQDTIDDAVESLNKLNWKVEVGMELSSDENQEYIQSVHTFINNTQDLLEQEQYTVNLNLDLLLGDSPEGQSLKTKINQFYQDSLSSLTGLGNQLSKATTKAFEDGFLDFDEKKELAELQSKIANLTEMYSSSEFDAKLSVLGMEFGGDLTVDSLKNLMGKIDEQIGETKEGYKEALTYNLANLNEMKSEGVLSEDEYNQGFNEYQSGYRNNIADLESRGTNFLSSLIQQQYVDDFENGKPSLNDSLNEYSDIINNYLNSGLDGIDASVLWDTVATGIADYDGMDSETKQGLNKLFELLKPRAEQLEEMKKQYVEAGMQVPEGVSEGLNDADLIGALSGDPDSIFKLLGEEATNNSEFISVLQEYRKHGGDIPESFSDGIEENKYKISDKVSSMHNYTQMSLDATFGIGFTVDVPINLKETVTEKKNGWAAYANGTGLPGHAEGGIFTQPHIAWFAEDGPEAAVPLDGSKEAITIWEMAGRALGVLQEQTGSNISGGYSAYSGKESNYQSNGYNISYSPNIIIQGNADEKVINKALGMDKESFKKMADEYFRQKVRTSYGH
ncbi:MAG: phage tail tape measure protein [Velocimicrobium sp.]